MIIQKGREKFKVMIDMKRKIQNMIKSETMKDSIENEEDRVEWSINFTGVTKMKQNGKRVIQNDVYKKKLDTVYNKRQPRQKKEKMNYRELD